MGPIYSLFYKINVQEKISKNANNNKLNQVNTFESEPDIASKKKETHTTNEQDGPVEINKTVTKKIEIIDDGLNSLDRHNININEDARPSDIEWAAENQLTLTDEEKTKLGINGGKTRKQKRRRPGKTKKHRRGCKKKSRSCKIKSQSCKKSRT